MLGGGVGIGFGIRSADDKSTGVMPHLKMYDASSLAFRQGRTRRGSYAAYLDISHPEKIGGVTWRTHAGPAGRARWRRGRERRGGTRWSAPAKV